MEEFLKQLGQKIREGRLAKGLTQKDLAERTGVPEKRISQIENGKVNITMSTLHDLTKAVGLELKLE